MSSYKVVYNLATRSVYQLNSNMFMFCLISPFRIIHDHGFSPEDYKQYKPVVFSNTIYSLLTIIRAMDKLRIDFDTDLRLVRECLFFHEFPVFFFVISVSSYSECEMNDVLSELLCFFLVLVWR